MLVRGHDQLIPGAHVERVQRTAVPKHSLTPRELEVLYLMAEGLGTIEIARRLYITRKTVATHVERIFRKLGVHTRTQAVSVAYRHGFLDRPNERLAALRVE